MRLAGLRGPPAKNEFLINQNSDNPMSFPVTLSSLRTFRIYSRRQERNSESQRTNSREARRCSSNRQQTRRVKLRARPREISRG